MTPETFDAIIIGTGQSGKPLAIALGKAGWKTAVIERKYVGGTCINDGCTPTKTMVASARVAYLARRGQDYRVHAGGDVRVNMAEVYRRKQGVVEQFRNGGQHALESTPQRRADLRRGQLVDARTVRVALKAGGERLLTAPKVVINTGGRPAVPPIPGLGDVRFLDSTSIMDLETLPSHLVVLGGGYIGLEFSQMFRRFGARVTIVNRDDRLIPREDPDVVRGGREDPDRGRHRRRQPRRRDAGGGQERRAAAARNPGRREAGSKAAICSSRSAGRRTPTGSIPPPRASRPTSAASSR